MSNRSTGIISFTGSCTNNPEVRLKSYDRLMTPRENDNEG